MRQLSIDTSELTSLYRTDTSSVCSAFRSPPSVDALYFRCGCELHFQQRNLSLQTQADKTMRNRRDRGGGIQKTGEIQEKETYHIILNSFTRPVLVQFY